MTYHKPIVIVDVETTGMSPSRGRITEIACIRLENGKETDRFVTLLDPEQNIPLQIQAATNITNEMVKDAPTFVQIAPRIHGIFKDAVLCAHNARFDYSFIKAEMERSGYEFKKTLLCTAKMSRSVFPKHRHHDLSSLIERHGFTCAARHRAEGDADVLVQFLDHVESKLGAEKTLAVTDKICGAKNVPHQLDPKILADLPETPGVYTFYGEDGEVLYIGKSVNIRSRIMSHFSNTHKDGKEMRLWDEVRDIGCESTISDLGASLLELKKIKSEYPKYNRASRRVKGMWYLEKFMNDKGYVAFELVPDREIVFDDLKNLYAVFKTKKQAVSALTELAKEHKVCPKLLGAESGKGACFSSQLGLCSGACSGKAKQADYNRQIEAIFAERKLRIWPYKNKVTLKYYDKNHEKAEVFIIDNWMLEQALVYEEEEPRPLLDGFSQFFDYDVYKVLVRHMKNA
ncbi:MAG: polC [Candidatus Parcubacteria bacterium]|nr:polC [Candidatus Parcubacteria bacterium]